jgi:hypothetical protein
MKAFTMVKILSAIIICAAGQAFAWTVTADFESGTAGNKAQGASGFSYAGTATTFASDQAHSGTKSAKMVWPKGSEGWGIVHGELALPSPITEGQEIWARGYYYFSSPWSWGSGYVKVLRLTTMYSNGTSSGLIGIVENNGNIVFSNEPDTSFTYNDTLTSSAFDVGRWQCLEVYVKFSSSDPIFRVWKDGVLIKEDRTHRVVRQSGNYIPNILVMGIWNSPYAPQNQTQYVDDFIITTDRPSQVDSNGNRMIGPSGASSGGNPGTVTPAPPAGLKVLP